MYNPAHVKSGAVTPKQKQAEIDALWQQIEIVRNQTASAAKEYRDVRAQQMPPSETAAERYQHRQVQKDFARAQEAADSIAKNVEQKMVRLNEEACLALEGGVAQMAEEKARLQARLVVINGELERMQSAFKKELELMEQQTSAMMQVPVGP